MMLFLCKEKRIIKKYMSKSNLLTNSGTLCKPAIDKYVFNHLIF